MADNYKLLTRLLVGVLKHQANRYLGEEVISVLAQAGSEHLGERLLDLLKGEESSREQAKRLGLALKSAADELEREQAGVVDLRLDDAPIEIVEAVVDALANLESGDLLGRQLQSAIQNLVAAVAKTHADNSLRISMQLYQAVLMAVLTIPELQPRAQDLLHQSRIWLLGEQIRRIELMTQLREEPALAIAEVKELRSAQLGEVAASGEDKLEAGRLVANGRVELVKQVGQGGQASVWMGRLTDTGDKVGVRFLNDELKDRREIVRSFFREADIIQTLSGTAVIQLVEPAISEEGRYFYVVDYVENAKSFAQVIQSSEISVEEKLGILSSVAAALHAIHQRGYIHGDVKPENILIEGPGNEVRFVDLGSAQKIGEHDADEPITFTYRYAAPEMLALHHTTPHESQTTSQDVRISMAVGPPLDIYPLGIMLFQALDPGLGRVARMEEYGLVGRLMVDRDLKAVIRKAIARAPGDRFESALDFKQALEDAVRAASVDDADA